MWAKSKLNTAANKLHSVWLHDQDAMRHCYLAMDWRDKLLHKPLGKHLWNPLDKSFKLLDKQWQKLLGKHLTTCLLSKDISC